MRVRNLTLGAAVLVLSAASLSAGTINFGTDLPLGNRGASASIGGLTITAWEVSKTNLSNWTGTTINNRNETPNDVGLGVCPVGASCPATGYGEVNEIDNNGSMFDVLRIQVASGYSLNAIGLSSLDSGLKDNFAIFGSNTANPNFGSLTLLAQGSNQSIGSINPNISVSSAYRYYYVSNQARTTADCNSDFLVRSASVNSAVPEPFTMSTIGAGLLLMAARWRRARR